jgi:hypothetical protein
MDEVAWLMRSYDVKGVSFAIVSEGKVVAEERYGARIPALRAQVRALGDSLSAAPAPRALRTLADSAGDVTLMIGNPRKRSGIVVVAHGGWGGRQITLHVAQRVAQQEGWADIPR